MDFGKQFLFALLQTNLINTKYWPTWRCYIS